MPSPSPCEFGTIVCISGTSRAGTIVPRSTAPMNTARSLAFDTIAPSDQGPPSPWSETSEGRDPDTS